jgi:rhodanese-related sulfurtransferase
MTKISEILALSAMFMIAVYSAYALSLPSLLFLAALIAGLTVSLLPFRYFGWPYAERGKYTDLTPMKLYAIMEEKKGFSIIDVRTRREYARSHIPGAVNRPLLSLKKGEQFKQPTVFICSTGHRSRMALRKVEGRELYNLESGYKKWLEANLPVSGVREEG